ncbi:TlpA disulfide reductase family protein [Hymenobacter latericus]|uniref:TlpA disulfide reductase family protein n=1 Tax=Hymenobacter sp. YIM 151858-1 TaxID=2987688 RepID=UPI002226A447|nr:TlpA disulfide reductase family protein [Hymenobacter sp. YIM 151858-1]UYZ60762.1 AhpC/TSA family protein [Hymenobacter sp. YIM 151858-1]
MLSARLTLPIWFRYLLLVPAVLLVIALGAGACQRQAAPTASVSSGPTQFEVQGQLSNATEGTRIVLADGTDPAWRRLDSTSTDAAGRFALRGQVAEPAVYTLLVGPKAEPVPVALDNTARVLLTADVNQLTSTSQQSGTADAQVLQRFQEVMRGHRQRTQELIKQGEQRSGPWNDAWSERIVGTKQLITQHPTSFVAAYATVDLSGYSREEALLDSLTNHFAAALPNSRYTQVLLGRQRARQATAVGKPAPELSLPGPNGQPVALSSLRGRYVLIDFWASWCKPCRQENPAMVKLYRQYQPRGFEVYAVSLDDSREKWLKAVDADQLPWIQVSDLQGFSSPSAEAYDARAIPLTVLLDPEGRIVGKDLRGKQLEEKLAKLFP